MCISHEKFTSMVMTELLGVPTIIEVLEETDFDCIFLNATVERILFVVNGRVLGNRSIAYGFIL